MFKTMMTAAVLVATMGAAMADDDLQRQLKAQQSEIEILQGKLNDLESATPRPSYRDDNPAMTQRVYEGMVRDREAAEARERQARARDLAELNRLERECMRTGGKNCAIVALPQPKSKGENWSPPEPMPLPTKPPFSWPIR